MPDGTPPTAPKHLGTAAIAGGILAVVIVAAGVAARASDASEAQRWSDARATATVQLVAARPAAASSALVLPGTMEAWNAAKIYARVNGYVKGWYHDIGNPVGDGTPLGTIDTPELDQQIAQARADLSSARANAGLARSTAARWNDLLSSNSVSHQEADEKNGDLAAKSAAVQAAEANLQRLLALKQFATLRAPFAGIVTQRNADIGDLVGPGGSGQQALFTVADVRRIRLYVSVPQIYSAAIHPGLPATLTVPDYPDRKITATVIGAAGAINSQTGTQQVQLVADNRDGLLKPGGYGQVAFDVPGQSGLVQIPSSALVFRADGTEVAMVGPDDRVRMRPIHLGRDLGGTVEVTAGLRSAERVIDNPPDSIEDGTPVILGRQNG